MIGSLASDSIGKDKLVVPAGGYALLVIAVKETSTGSAVPIDSTWLDQDPLFTITDPDAVTLSWNTNELDSGDPNDDFDENRSSYVGDLFSPEIPGLHAILDGTTGTPTRLAIKIKAPTAAEQTSANSLRDYDIEWFLPKNGQLVPNLTEAFNVGPPGLPVFGNITVLWSDVDITGASSITVTAEQDAFIQQAGNEVYGWISGCGLNPDSLPVDADTRAIKTAIIQVTRDAVAGVDLGFAQAVKSIREEPRSIVYSTKGDQLSQYERAKQTVEMWCRRYRAFRNVKSAVARQRPADGLHGHDDP